VFASAGSGRVASVGKYRAAGGPEARLFFAMLACIANAADHKIVQRGCISFKRTDMITVI
jgi:hypothetical protein